MIPSHETSPRDLSHGSIKLMASLCWKHLRSAPAWSISRRLELLETGDRDRRRDRRAWRSWKRGHPPQITLRKCSICGMPGMTIINEKQAWEIKLGRIPFRIIYGFSLILWILPNFSNDMLGDSPQFYGFSPSIVAQISGITLGSRLHPNRSHVTGPAARWIFWLANFKAKSGVGIDVLTLIYG